MKKVVVVGGGAGGMTFAAQIKKFSDKYDVSVFDKGTTVGWAGCPTPYWIADKLPDSSCLGSDGNVFKQRGINVYTEHEVQKLNFNEKKILVKGSEINGVYDYDVLVLSLGGKPNHPKITGINSNGVFRLSHISDAVKIKEYIKQNNVEKVTVIGAGFIGLEMAESFEELGLDVTIIERANHILPRVNQSLLTPIYDKLKEKEIEMHLETSVVEIKSEDDKIKSVILDNGEEKACDLLLISIGISPNTDLLVDSGFKLNDGKLFVNDKFETSEKNVYALGDLIYVDNIITGKKVYAPYGDVADKQGIILAKNLAGKDIKYKGVYGSFATSFYDIRIAGTGLSLKEALDEGFNAKTTTVRAVTKISSFDDHKGGTVEIIYDDDTKRILGGFMLGNEAVAQFIDQVSLAVYNKMTFDDVIMTDYSYSPTNSSVWNPLLAAYRRVMKGNI